MLTIGLTGSIGSGKTTVANFFARYGTPIIDADLIAKELTQPHTEIYRKIVEHFSHLPVFADWIIDRKKLRNFIFDDLKEKKWLESLLHPLIRQEIQQQIHSLKNTAYCIVVIPLLLESGAYKFLDRVLIVEADQMRQIEWLKARDNTTGERIQQILNAQASPEMRKKHAHDVINNHGDLEALKEQVKCLHDQYVKLSSEK